MPSCWSKASLQSTQNTRDGGGFSLEVLERRPGEIILRIQGRAARASFAAEAGGHRWQRVPPNEKRGRTHTSTITVAVLPEPSATALRIDPKECRIDRCRGSGAGGQHRNVTESAVQITHLKTGLTVRVEGDRSQHANQEAAFALLRARLMANAEARAKRGRDQMRKKQIGRGERGDKRRTIRAQDDRVVDHLTGKRTSMKRYLRGYLEDLMA